MSKFSEKNATCLSKLPKLNPRHHICSLEDKSRAEENVNKIYCFNGKPVHVTISAFLRLWSTLNAKINTLDLPGLKINPHMGPKTLGIVYNSDTNRLLRLKNMQKNMLLSF